MININIFETILIICASWLFGYIAGKKVKKSPEFLETKE